MANKFGNKQCISSDGTVFPSKRERARYEDLRLLERMGEISDLKIQVEYELIPKQKVGKRAERACSYVCDFAYFDKLGQSVVEDTKGFRTRDYVIKRKLMLQVHGIAVEEV